MLWCGKKAKAKAKARDAKLPLALRNAPVSDLWVGLTFASVADPSPKSRDPETTYQVATAITVKEKESQHGRKIEHLFDIDKDLRVSILFACSLCRRLVVSGGLHAAN